jgi:steroid 5-alpha reductase family enzyme
MLYLILFVTGVPAAEESSLRSRGEKFRRYQRETSAFVPWVPKTQLPKDVS